MSEHAGTTAKPPHPFFYFLLFLPFGATAGFISVTIGGLLSSTGVSDEVVTGLTAINTLPHTWKFLWAPLVDTVWTGRGWYITTNLISSACIIALGFIPMTESNISIMVPLIFINGVSTTFIGMCTEALMAKLTPPEQRGAAGGWSQAGNLGGATIGGLGLLLADNLAAQWMPFVIVGGLLLSCSMVLLTVKEPARDKEKMFGTAVSELVADLGGLLLDPKRADSLTPKWLLGIPPLFVYALSGAGILAIALSLMPIGSGGAQNVLPLAGNEWTGGLWKIVDHTVQATVTGNSIPNVTTLFGVEMSVKTMVAFTNGLGTGLSMILGSLLGGALASKVDKRWAYAISGVTLALFSFGFALLPKTPEAYVIGCLFYGLGLGMCYATFTSFVLDIIGHTGGATKYNLFASLANMPIYIMAVADGWVATKYGRTAMLWFDGLAGVAGAVVLMTIVFALRKRRLDPAPSE